MPPAESWVQNVLRKRIVVHTKSGQSIEGSLSDTMDDGLVLRAATLLNDEGPPTTMAPGKCSSLAITSPSPSSTSSGGPVTQLRDTTPHPGMARINELLAQLETEIAALPLAYGEEHAKLQGAFHRFRAAFNGVVPVKQGRAVVLVDGLQRYAEVTNNGQRIVVTDG